MIVRIQGATTGAYRLVPSIGEVISVANGGTILSHKYHNPLDNLKILGNGHFLNERRHTAEKIIAPNESVTKLQQEHSA